MMADEEREGIKSKYAHQISEMQSLLSGTWEEKAKLSQEHESQLQRALEEQKRQARAMEEECRKRFRLLQDQNDLELSIKGLIDTLQSLPQVSSGPKPLLS